MAELILNNLLRLGRVDIANDVQQNIVGTVMRPMPRLDIGRLPTANELLLPNGEALGQPILPMQSRQNLALHPILNGVDHGHLRQDRCSFLLQPGRLDAGLHHIAQRIEGHGEHGDVAPRRGGGTGGVEDGVMEIGVGIGLGAGTEQPLALPRPHVRHVLGKVGDSLLRFELVGCYNIHRQLVNQYVLEVKTSTSCDEIGS